MPTRMSFPVRNVTHKDLPPVRWKPMVLLFNQTMDGVSRHNYITAAVPCSHGGSEDGAGGPHSTSTQRCDALAVLCDHGDTAT